MCTLPRRSSFPSPGHCFGHACYVVRAPSRPVSGETGTQKLLTQWGARNGRRDPLAQLHPQPSARGLAPKAWLAQGTPSAQVSRHSSLTALLRDRPVDSSNPAPTTNDENAGPNKIHKCDRCHGLDVAEGLRRRPGCYAPRRDPGAASDTAVGGGVGGGVEVSAPDPCKVGSLTGDPWSWARCDDTFQ